MCQFETANKGEKLCPINKVLEIHGNKLKYIKKHFLVILCKYFIESKCI